MGKVRIFFFIFILNSLCWPALFAFLETERDSVPPPHSVCSCLALPPSGRRRHLSVCSLRPPSSSRCLALPLLRIVPPLSVSPCLAPLLLLCCGCKQPPSSNHTSSLAAVPTLWRASALHRGHSSARAAAAAQTARSWTALTSAHVPEDIHVARRRSAKEAAGSSLSCSTGSLNRPCTRRGRSRRGTMLPHDLLFSGMRGPLAQQLAHEECTASAPVLGTHGSIALWKCGRLLHRAGPAPRSSWTTASRCERPPRSPRRAGQLAAPFVVFPRAVTHARVRATCAHESVLQAEVLVRGPSRA